LKTYIVYKNGIEMGLVKAGNSKSAEKKATKKFGDTSLSGYGKAFIEVVYTEI